jgi:hypothetical protein
MEDISTKKLLKGIGCYSTPTINLLLGWVISAFTQTLELSTHGYK